MAASPTVIDSLVEFYDADGIRALWQQVFNARMSRSTEPLHINMASSGGRSHGAIVLATPQEMDDFIEACKIAIKQKNNDNTVAASQIGTSTTFAGRVTTV